MKPTLMLLALAGALILTGCDTPTPSLLSLDPVVSGAEAIFEPALLGVWEASKGNDLCVFQREGDNAYTVTHVNGESARRFEARLFQAGEARVLDLAPDSNDDFQVAGHALVRIWTEGGGLRWVFLDSEWLRGQAAQQLPNHAIGEKKMLLTAPGAAIRDFLAKHGVDDKAHGDVIEYRRLQ